LFVGLQKCSKRYNNPDYETIATLIGFNVPLIEKIQSYLPRFTPSHKKIAHFILSYRDEAAFMTAKQLANAVSVSDAAVIRFAQFLGYKGFAES